MVGFIKDEKINLIDRNECMHKTLKEYLCCAYNDHVFCKVLLPSFFNPQIASHLPTKSLDLVAQIALKHGKLLKDEGYTVHLKSPSEREPMWKIKTYKKERNTVFPAIRSMMQLLVKDVP